MISSLAEKTQIAGTIGAATENMTGTITELAGNGFPVQLVLKS
jgi:hypothetical protein